VLRAALAILDTQVPTSARADASELQRARLLVGLLWVLLVPMPVFVANHVLAGRALLAWSSVLLAAGLVPSRPSWQT